MAGVSGERDRYLFYCREGGTRGQGILFFFLYPGRSPQVSQVKFSQCKGKCTQAETSFLLPSSEVVMK